MQKMQKNIMEKPQEYFGSRKTAEIFQAAFQKLKTTEKIVQRKLVPLAMFYATISIDEKIDLLVVLKL